MKKNLPIMIFLLLANLAAVAQTVKLNGTIVDINNQPIEAVNVAVIALPDSAFVVGSTTDSKGKFSMKVSTGGDLLVKVSFIGYTSEQIEIKNPQGSVQMGDIILSEQSVALNEVVVSGNNITPCGDKSTNIC